MNDLKHLQLKHKNYINIESPEEIKKQINNQQQICYICCDTLTLNSQEKDEVVIKTKCNHFYHRNCYKTIDKCSICDEQLDIVDEINLHHSEWWIVESFWEKNFGINN